MKKIVLIAAIAIALTACEKEEEVKPETKQEQSIDASVYAGTWRYYAQGCVESNVKITHEGGNKLKVGNNIGVLKGTNLKAGAWDIDFITDNSATANYMVCSGILNKLY